MKQFTISTYNIRHLLDADFNTNRVAEEVLGAGTDVVAFQEVDRFTERSHGMDEVAALSAALQFPFTSFDKAIDYQGGGYGISTISRYPLLHADAMHYDHYSVERRVLLHTVIDVEGEPIDIFNTHLSFHNGEMMRRTQIAQIHERVAGMERFILCGDFNTTYDELRPYFDEDTILVNGEMGHFRSFRTTGSGIDNIIVKGMEVCEARMSFCALSDHEMLTARIKLPQRE